MRPATLTDVARAAGVSPMTVSRALRGVGRVKDATRRRVRAAAEKLGYLATEGVLSPARHRGSTEPGLRLLVVSQPGLRTDDEIDQEVRRGLVERLAPTGGVVEFCTATSLEEIIACWDEYRAGGLVLRAHLPEAWVRALRRRGPVVQGASFDFCPGVDAVFCNELRAAGMVLQYLSRHGHERILWLGLNEARGPGEYPPALRDASSVVDRQFASIHGPRYGAWAYLASTAPATQRLLIPDRDYTSETLAAVVGRELAPILAEPARPTAIVVPTDFMGEKLLHVLTDAGLRVPADISVVCYGGTSLSRRADPPLTCVKLPMYMVGRTIPELVERRLSDPEALPMTVQLEARLAEGASVAPPPRHGGMP